MKSRYLLLSLLATLVFTSCSKSDYRDVIPQDCRTVVSLDMATAAKKADLDAQQMADKVKRLLSGGAAGDKVRAAMQRLGTLPGKVGIDFTSRIYAFPFGQDYFGFVARVDDEGDMEDFFDALQKQGVCSKMEKRRGFQWTSFSDGWQAAFDDEVLLFAGPGMDATMLQRAMLDRLQAEDGLTETPLFEQLEKQTGEITFCVAASLLPEKLQAPICMALPDKTNMQAVLLTGGVTFDASQIALHTSIWSDNASLEKACEAIDASKRTISAKTLATVPSGVVGCFAGNFDGEQLLKSMRQDKGMRALLLTANFGVDADLMVRSIDGDVCMKINGVDAGGATQYVMEAQVRNTDFMKNAGYWKKSASQQEGLSVSDDGPGGLYYHTPDFNIFFGTRGPLLYMSTSTMKGVAVGQPASQSLQTLYGKQAAGCHLLGYVNFDALQRQPVAKAGGATVYSLIGQLDKSFKGALMTSRNGRDIEISLLQRQSGNMLKHLLK
jgi:hypothetical protein